MLVQSEYNEIKGIVRLINDALAIESLFLSYSGTCSCSRVWNRVLSIFCLLNNQEQADWVLNRICIRSNQV